MDRVWHKTILHEIDVSMDRIDEAQLDALVEALCVPGRRVLCTGVGRVLISMKAWVKRLCHLEIDINYVGDETEKPVGEGDLLLVASASGESIVPVQIAKKAKSVGASVAYIGCTPASSADSVSDLHVIMAGRTKFSAGVVESIQPMSTLFEQQLYLLGDVIALEIMQRRGWTEEHIKDSHANLE